MRAPVKKGARSSNSPPEKSARDLLIEDDSCRKRRWFVRSLAESLFWTSRSSEFGWNKGTQIRTSTGTGTRSRSRIRRFSRIEEQANLLASREESAAPPIDALEAQKEPRTSFGGTKLELFEALPVLSLSLSFLLTLSVQEQV